MMKRAIALLLSLLCLLAVVAAAGIPEEQKTDVTITVYGEEELRSISPQLFGVIQNQGRMGEGAADPTGTPYPGFVDALVAMNATELRYPGGSMGGMIFDWREAIGPIEERTLTYARTSNPGQILNYGVDEMAQMAEACGMTINLCINSHMLGVKEALQYLAYTTMEADDTPLTELDSENDLQYWANLRAQYGHKDPYTVTRVDIGNEEDGLGGWRAGTLVSYNPRYIPAMDLESDSRAQRLYAFGGITEFTNVTTITYEDLSKKAAVSDGTPNMQKRAPYVDIVDNGTCHIFVNGEEWTIVDTFEKQSPNAKVCTVNYDTGYITFGDGKQGAIPAQGTVITITYQTEHEGYLDYYYAIHEKFPDIHVSAKTSTEEFMKIMGDKHPYDSISYHPLGANQPNATVTDFIDHYYQQLAAIVVTMQQEDVRLQKLREYSGENHPELILSAYGHAQGNLPKGQKDWHLNLAEGLMCAGQLFEFIDNDFKTACNFLLNDMPYDSDTTDAPDARRYNAMIYSRLGDDTFITTPKGLAFSMVAALADQTQIRVNIDNNPTVPLNKYIVQADGGQGMFTNYLVENPRTDSIDVLKALSAKDYEGNLTLIVINQHATDELAAKISLDDYLRNSLIEVEEFNGADFTTINTPDNPKAVSISERSLLLRPGYFFYSFPAHSITKFSFSTM